MNLWDEPKSRLSGKEKPEHLRRGELGEGAAKDEDPGNLRVNFRGEKRRNDPHQSTTDPEKRAVSESTWQRSEAVFWQTHPEGEPPRSVRRFHTA